VFLDKDGTLVENVPYNVDCSRIRFADGAEQALLCLQERGFRIVVVTNQPGVALGRYSSEDVERVGEWLRHKLALRGVFLSGFYWCPHHPDGVVPELRSSCVCRKPQPGLILRACRELNLDAASSWMIGDILDDVEAGRAAGCRTVLLDIGHETEWSISDSSRLPHHAVGDFREIARIVSMLSPNSSKGERAWTQAC
jgi:D,D-heptose 1,7-bisphosphate phosphatase